MTGAVSSADSTRTARWAPHAIALAALGAIVLCALVSRRTYKILVQEDGWIEWATFLAFVAAGVIAARGALDRARPRLLRILLAGLALFSIFVAGEEISWGQRMIGFRPP